MRPLIAVVGATGTGKSQLAVELALALNGEVVNADAMQMYRGLEVITNKHPARLQRGVPHHLLGTEPWTRKLTVRNFEKAADECIAQIHARGHVPVLVGGTHYYIQSSLFAGTIVESSGNRTYLEETGFKPPRPGRRKKGKGKGASASGTGDPNGEGAKADEPAPSPSPNPAPAPAAPEPPKSNPVAAMSAAEIEERLREVDPQVLAKFHPNDTRRLKRALEVFYETGTPASEIYKQQHLQPKYDALVFYVYCERGVLVDRLDARVDEMLRLGLVDEVNDMIMECDGENAASGVFQSIGFRQLQPLLLENAPLAPGIAEMKRETCRYAKQQTKWVKNKLAPMIDAYGGTLAVVNSTDPAAWAAQMARAVSIAKAFVDKSAPEQMPELVPAALAPHLTRAAPLYAPDAWTRHRCDACSQRADRDVVILGPQWAKHLASRGHLSAVRRMQPAPGRGPTAPTDAPAPAAPAPPAAQSD